MRRRGLYHIAVGRPRGEPRANTMSVTADSRGSTGEGEEQHSKHKDDEAKQVTIVKRIVE